MKYQKLLMKLELMRKLLKIWKHIKLKYNKIKNKKKKNDLQVKN